MAPTQTLGSADKTERGGPSPWWLLLIVFILVFVCLFAWVLLSEHRFEFDQAFVDGKVTEALAKRAQTQETRKNEQNVREEECRTKLTRAACLPVKEHLADAIVVDGAKVTLGAQLARLDMVAHGEHGKHHFSIAVSGVGEPDYHPSTGEIYIRASTIKVGDVVFDGESPAERITKSRVTQAIGRVLHVDAEPWNEFVGWGAEKAEARLKKGAELKARQALERIPIYTIRTKPTDPWLTKTKLTLARLALKSATVENNKLVVVLSGDQVILTVLYGTLLVLFVGGLAFVLIRINFPI